MGSIGDVADDILAESLQQARSPATDPAAKESEPRGEKFSAETSAWKKSLHRSGNTKNPTIAFGLW